MNKYLLAGQAMAARFGLAIALVAAMHLVPARADEPVGDPDYELPSAGYEAYENCIAQIGKKLTNFAYPGVWSLSMRRVHLRVANDATACVALLPKDERVDAQKHLRSIIILSEPVSRSGIEHGSVAVSSGIVRQSTTGTSIVFSGEGGVELPQSSLFVMTDGYDVRLAGTAYLGSSIAPYWMVPSLKLSATGTKQIRGRLTRKDREKIGAFVGQLMVDKEHNETHADPKDKKDVLEPYLRGFDSVSLAHVIDLVFDRDKAMDRAWELGAGYGVQLLGTGKKIGGKVSAVGRIGAFGENADDIVPFVRLEVGGKGFYCPIASKNKKHLLCLSAGVAAKVGLLQAGIGAEGGVNYRYRMNDSASEWFHNFDVGTNVYGDTLGDPNGGHSVRGAMFGIKFN